MHYTELFDDRSDLYARARPSYPPALFRFLAEQCRATERAWDCACGSGQSAVDLVRYFDRVDATDVSPNQIAHALRHPRIAYAVGPSENTAFQAGRFDLVCVAQALHWMRFDAFWPEVKRVLKPDGLFAAWGYSWTRIEPEIDRRIQTHLLDVIEPYWAEQNRLLWHHYRDEAMPFEPIEAPAFAMETEWTLGELMAYLHTWSSTRRCIDAKGVGFFHTLVHEVADVWGDPAQSKPVAFDFCCIAGRSRG
jgi:SAM-dependent methyltransferase